MLQIVWMNKFNLKCKYFIRHASTSNNKFWFIANSTTFFISTISLFVFHQRKSKRKVEWLFFFLFISTTIRKWADPENLLLDLKCCLELRENNQASEHLCSSCLIQGEEKSEGKFWVCYDLISRMCVRVSWSKFQFYVLLPKKCSAPMFTFDLTCASPSILHTHVPSQNALFLLAHYRFVYAGHFVYECVLGKRSEFHYVLYGYSFVMIDWKLIFPTFVRSSTRRSSFLWSVGVFHSRIFGEWYTLVWNISNVFVWSAIVEWRVAKMSPL